MIPAHTDTQAEELSFRLITKLKLHNSSDDDGGDRYMHYQTEVLSETRHLENMLSVIHLQTGNQVNVKLRHIRN